ncbi:uncharacterized protein LOC664043 [Tribolium castaneum]|uniref:Thaumatin-like protein n=1 Tax=Tribolium castaneum TaxID=7070 RepID=D6W9V6_TRICA|nr:PREDICTED: thaumatin-like protein 1 [Tribolium castaneum]EEZ98105.1 hypothetical protein TcasGA2_TC000518 [Tribolium castaneum]|eukprot:XP_975156.1 PREDICTED: thaumatin-like protein 1 [Tribolium castaneum]
MPLIRIVLLSVYFTLISANFIRVNNTGAENLVLILEGVGHPPSAGVLITAGNYTELITLNEWEGSFYTYPEECLNAQCNYPVSRVSVAFERWMFGGFYDFFMVDLNRGFNVPASIKSITRPDCDVISCEANLLELCPEEDQIKNDKNQTVSCRTSALNYRTFKEKCPHARVDGSELDLGICASMNYELTFG